MDDPDPDPGSPLVPQLPSPDLTPPPPRSGTIEAPSVGRASDPVSPAEDLHIDGSGSESLPGVVKFGGGVVPAEEERWRSGPSQLEFQPALHPPQTHSSRPPASSDFCSSALNPASSTVHRLAGQRRKELLCGEDSTAFNSTDPPVIHCTVQETYLRQEREFEGINKPTSIAARIPAEQKGKQIQESASIHVASPAELPQEASGSHPGVQKASSGVDGEPARDPDRHRVNAFMGRASRAALHTEASGSEFFKKKLEGRCFNCFSPDHIARHCRSSPKCWKCYRNGHKASQCFDRDTIGFYKDRTPQLQATSTLKPDYSSSTRDSRSFAEVVRGVAPMAARYPGDPRARPARGFCAVSATGPIKRRRDELINRAVVCWLGSNSHDTETHHLMDAFLSKLGLHHDQFQIVKHYPEQFLVIFSEPGIRQRVLDRGGLSSRGRHFHFAPWNERLHATNSSWEYRVKVRIEGVPVHCWAAEVAAQALGKSCAIHYLEEKTRRRERTRTFDLWAWCSDPCDIPNEVYLTVTEPDREQPSASIPLPLAPTYHDDPVDIKRTHVFLLRNHLEIVEDLTFLQGRGRSGGHVNRKPVRELVWSYGAPDSVGERLPVRQGREHNRELGRRPGRDDDDYDFDRPRHGQGTRRHRSVSSWARNPRCKSGVQDCISSNKWRGGRSRVAPITSQKSTQVWRMKPTKGDKPRKKVSFADPIATVLQPPQRTIPDDSAMLIKVYADKGAAQVEQADNSKGDSRDESIQQVFTETLKLMQQQLADSGTHFQRPIEKAKMDAIQVLIEKGRLQTKKAGINNAMPAQVELEA